MRKIVPCNLDRATLIKIGTEAADRLSLPSEPASAEDAYHELYSMLRGLGADIIEKSYMDMCYQHAVSKRPYLRIPHADMWAVDVPCDNGPISRREHLAIALGHYILHTPDPLPVYVNFIGEDSDDDQCRREAIIFAEGFMVRSAFLAPLLTDLVPVKDIARRMVVSEQTVLNRINDHGLGPLRYAMS